MTSNTNTEARLTFKQAATGKTFLAETWAAEEFARRRIKEFSVMQRLTPKQTGDKEFVLQDSTGMTQVVCTIQ